jgi:hypothetical protein
VGGGGARRDFDINVDGLAHYGLLPGFLQDLKNLGCEMTSMLRSAEDYIVMWEICERQAMRVPAH